MQIWLMTGEYDRGSSYYASSVIIDLSGERAVITEVLERKDLQAVAKVTWVEIDHVLETKARLVLYCEGKSGDIVNAPHDFDFSDDGNVAKVIEAMKALAITGGAK